MKTKLTSILSILFLTIFYSSNLMAWGNDVIISQQAPTAQHGIAAKQNGTLYAAVPSSLLILEFGTLFYISNDQGATWNFHPVAAPSSISPVIRTKMIVTSLDSIICVIHQNNTLYFVNVESGVTGQFTTSGVQEFDVASGSGNFVYTYVQETGLNTIKRYGTGDGGLTWTGNTATVTTQGSRPRIHMSGTRLILNYYGPVLPDTVSSVIRAAIYNETVAGTLAAGTFQDVALNNGVKRKQFQTVVNNGLVWFLYTEGDAQQVIKCRASLDNGATYQPEFIVSGNAQINAYWFGAAPITYSGSFGVTLTWLADSIAPSTSFDKMNFAIASNSSPGVFTIPSAPLNTYNDMAVTSSATDILPIFVNYNMGLNVETGVAWVGETSSGPALYYDRLSATTGISQQVSQDDQFYNLYPSPANEIIYISSESDNISATKIELYSTEGKLMISVQIAVSTNRPASIHKINISELSSGNYFAKIYSENGPVFRKFTVVK